MPWDTQGYLYGCHLTTIGTPLWQRPSAIPIDWDEYLHVYQNYHNAIWLSYMYPSLFGKASYIIFRDNPKECASAKNGSRSPLVRGAVLTESYLAIRICFLQECGVTWFRGSDWHDVDPQDVTDTCITLYDKVRHQPRACLDSRVVWGVSANSAISPNTPRFRILLGLYTK